LAAGDVLKFDVRYVI